MTYKYRKMTTIILSSFLLFSQAACGSKTSPGEQPGPSEQPAEKPAEKTAETYQGYVYTTPEQLKTDLEDAAKEALSGLDVKKADIIGSFGSSMEEYRENYRKVTDWYDEEIMVSVQLYEKCESILRAVYSSIAGTAKKSGEFPEDLYDAYTAFSDVSYDYYYDILDSYAEVITSVHDAQDKLLKDGTIDIEQWKNINSTSLDDYETAENNSTKASTKFYQLVYYSYDEMNTLIENKDTDTDEMLSRIKQQVDAEGEKEYLDSGTEDETPVPVNDEISAHDYSPYTILHNINGDCFYMYDEILETDIHSLEVPEEQSYEEIYDKYADLVREKSEEAYNEYLTESAGITDPMELALLDEEKITEVAEIVKEANRLLCMFCFTKDAANFNNFNDVLDWGTRLEGFYYDETDKIYQEFVTQAGL